MAKFKVKTPVRHDGDNYEVGKVIELKKKAHAAPLLALGAIEPVNASKLVYEEDGAASADE